MSDATTDEEPGAGTRPWWRKLIEFPLVAMVIAAVVLTAGVGLAGDLVKLVLPDMVPETRVLYQNVAGVIAAIVAYKLVIRHLGAKKHDDLPWDGAVKETAAGLGIGFVLFSLIVGIAALAGIYRIVGPGDASHLVVALIASALFPGVVEELLFRGILFRWLEEFGGSWLALALTSALFGAAHLANPNASPVAAIGIALEAGVMLGAAYMLTRRLWLAIGIHIAWNFTQGEIWDVPVSGTYVHGLVKAELSGPPLLSGGGFGLEASLIAIVVATGFGAYLLVRAIRAGRVVGPMWVEARKSAARIAPEA